MNSTQVVRADVSEDGVRLRLWIDDESGKHVTVAELTLGRSTLESWWREAHQARLSLAAQEAMFDA